MKNEKQQRHSVIRTSSQRAKAGAGPRKAERLLEPTIPDEQEQLPPTSDAGGGISEGTLRDASGSETGGGSDTPLHAEQSTEAAIQQKQPLHQGTNAYPGGGADNGSNL